MSRWIARGIGILLLIVFALMLMHLQRRLMEMQKSRRAPSTTTSTSRYGHVSPERVSFGMGSAGTLRQRHCFLRRLRSYRSPSLLHERSSPMAPVGSCGSI